MNDNKDTTKLGFLIFPGFPMSCLTSAIEPLRAANEIAGKVAFTWQLISEHGTQVDSSANIRFDPDIELADVEGLDFLVLLSGPLARFENQKRGNGLLRHFARHGGNVGGVSGGVFPLARSGLLDGYKCSVHWCYEAAFSAEFPQLNKMDDVIVVDRNRYSVSGAAAVFDLMLLLIEDKLGKDIMTEVACWFQHPLVRGRGVRQKTPTFRSESTSDMLPHAIKKAIQIFDENIEDPVKITDVADAVGLSARQMERVFKQSTGQSPSHYYRALRLSAARQMVLYSNDTLTEIANAVGYATSTQMRQNYRKVFGQTPDEERQSINMFRVEDNRSIPST